MPRPQAPHIEVERWADGTWSAASDQVAAEEPLQLYVDGEAWTVVMRTPGDDVELALGLMFGERVIDGLDGVERILASAELSGRELTGTGPPVGRVLLESNAIDVRLAGGGRPRPQRSLPVSSACGICGQTTLEDLAVRLEPLTSDLRLDPATLPALTEQLRAGQGVFDQTGGLHAAGLFTPDGRPLVIREDIGRHNAVDKVVGRALLDGIDTRAAVLAVSGRVGFEVAQKAIAASIPVVVAVGAPSSLAVAAARRFDLTLVGFLRGRRFNVYAAGARLDNRAN